MQIGTMITVRRTLFLMNPAAKLLPQASKPASQVNIADSFGRQIITNRHRSHPIPLERLGRDHWEAVRSIYLQGIATGNATFQQTAPDWEEWDRSHLRNCRLVARIDGEIAGWAALSAVSARPVYSGVAEVSIYIAEAARGRGAGSALLSRLIADSETENIWTLQAGIFPENVASVELHKRAGFRIVGTRERLGCMNGVWRDVVLMERRRPK